LPPVKQETRVRVPVRANIQPTACNI